MCNTCSSLGAPSGNGSLVYSRRQSHFQMTKCSISHRNDLANWVDSSLRDKSHTFETSMMVRSSTEETAYRWQYRYTKFMTRHSQGDQNIWAINSFCAESEMTGNRHVDCLCSRICLFIGRAVGSKINNPTQFKKCTDNITSSVVLGIRTWTERNLID